MDNEKNKRNFNNTINVSDQLEQAVNTNLIYLSSWFPYVKEQIIIILKKHIDYFIKEKAAESAIKYKSLGNGRFYFDKNIYETIVITGSGTSAEYQIMIRDINAEIRRKKITAKIEEAGHQAFISVTADKPFSNDKEEILDFLLEDLRIGYRWLTEKTLATIENMRTDVSRRLYERTKIIFPEELAKNIWFYTVINNIGFYLSDSFMDRVTITRVSNPNLRISKTPAEILFEFHSTLLEDNNLLSKYAIRTGDLISYDLSNKQYSAVGFELSEQIFLNTLGLEVVPLVRHGGWGLVAGVPSVYKNEIIPILLDEKDNFTTIFEKGTKELKKFLSIVNEQQNSKFQLLDPELVAWAYQITPQIISKIWEKL